MPVSQWGKTHIVSSYDETASYAGGTDPTGPVVDWRSQFLVVAGKCGAKVRVSPIKPIQWIPGGTFPPGEDFDLILAPYETVLMQSENDVTGTRITSIEDEQYDGTFAVFSGNQCTSVGNCPSCDHLFIQQPPISHAGKTFALKGPSRRSSNAVRVTATEGETEIFGYGGQGQTDTFTLAAAGDFRDFIISTQRNETHPLTADKPVLVNMLSQGLFCDSPNWFSGWGDPSMWNIPALERATTVPSTFLLPTLPPSRDGSQPWLHSLVIACDSSLVPYLRINGSDQHFNLMSNPPAYVSIGTLFQSLTDNPRWEMAEISWDLSHPTHVDENRQKTITLELPNGFDMPDGAGYVAWLVGMANFDSYGMTVASAGIEPSPAKPCGLVSRKATARTDFGARLYPNPAANRTEIRWPAASGTLQLEVYDLSGRQRFSQALDAAQGQNSLNLTDFPAGLYFVRLESNGQSQAIRLVVE